MPKWKPFHSWGSEMVSANLDVWLWGSGSAEGGGNIYSYVHVTSVVSPIST